MSKRNRQPATAAGRAVFVGSSPEPQTTPQEVNLQKPEKRRSRTTTGQTQWHTPHKAGSPSWHPPGGPFGAASTVWVPLLVGLGIVLVSVVLAFYVNLLLAIAFAVICLWQFYVRYVQVRWPIGSGRPQPQMGWQRVLTQVLRILGIYYTPKQSVAELIFIEEVRHRQLAADRDIEFVCFGPTGGVGKGTAATNMAAISAEVTHAPTLICDSRNKRGNVAERYGLRRMLDSENPTLVIPRATITIRQAVVAFELGLFEKAVWAYRIIRRFEGSYLHVIASDVSTPEHERPDLDVARLRRAWDQLAQHFRLMFHEADNDRGLALDLELIRRCEVPVLVTQVKKYAAHSELLDALNFYRANPELRKKLERSSVLMVLATSKKDTVDVYAEIFGLKPEQVFLVPVDAYFQAVEDDVSLTLQNKPQRPIIDTKKMKRRSYLQYLRAMNQGMSTVPIEPIPYRPLESSRHQQATTPTPQQGSSVPAPTTAADSSNEQTPPQLAQSEYDNVTLHFAPPN